MKAEPAQKEELKPHAIRLRLLYFNLKWAPGIEKYPERLSTKRFCAGRAILDICFDLANSKDWSFEREVRTIARAVNCSVRTAGKKLVGLERLGLIVRAPQGPKPWAYKLNIPKLLRLSAQHKVRYDALDEEAKERHRARLHSLWRERRAQLVDEDLADAGDDEDFDRFLDEPPGEDEDDAGDDDQADVLDDDDQADAGDDDDQADTGARRRPSTGRAATGPRRTDPHLASLLWNSNPWRREGTEELTAATRWPQRALQLDPEELHACISLYFRATLQGSTRFADGPQRWQKFKEVLSDLRQLNENREMAEPGLGRQLRPRSESDAYQAGHRHWRPPELPTRSADDPRAALLAAWLRPHYSSPRWNDLLWEALRQRGPPPDWIPPPHDAEWGKLPVFLLT